MKNTYKIIGDVTEIFYTRRCDKVPYTILIDTIDLPLIDSYTTGSWYVGKFKTGKRHKIYATTTAYHNGKRVNNMLMHRLILQPKGKLHSDHQNECTLDNRRCNLKAVSRSVNVAKQLLTDRVRSVNKTGHRNIRYAPHQSQKNPYSVVIRGLYHGVWPTLEAAQAQAAVVRKHENWQNIGIHSGEPEPPLPKQYVRRPKRAANKPKPTASSQS